jgi:hypothetical protein
MLLGSPAWEEFSISVWNRGQTSRVRNFDSFLLVPAIPVQKAYYDYRLDLLTTRNS